MSRVLIAVISVVVWLAAGQSAAQEKKLNASGGWVKLPAAADTQAMAFATVENPTSYVVYVVKATADVAGNVELRDGSLAGDASLKPAEFLTAPAYESLTMGPKGGHLMLLDLKRPLKEGDTVAITLTTDSGEALQVRATVKKD